jgi:hypothetical protein
MPNKKTKNQKAKRLIRNLLFDKRAISVALTTMIITAGVLAAGIAVLYWATSWGNVANHQYAQTVENSQSAIQESIGFEYITYSLSGQLSIYIINCGKSNNLSLARAYLWDSAHQPLDTYEIASIYNIATQIEIPHDPNTRARLNIGDEAYIRLTPSTPLTSGEYYTIRLVTERGRNFDQTFAAPYVSP